MTYEAANVPNETMYGDRDTLVAYAVSEQARINALDSSEDVLAVEARRLLADLNEACPYVGRNVRIKGDRVFRVPVIDPELVGHAEADDGVETTDIDSTLQFQTAVGQDEDIGMSCGFTLRQIVVEVDGFEFGTRYVVCHQIDTGIRTVAVNEEANLVYTHTIDHFPVEGSVLTIEDDYYGHDIRHLRRSDEVLYEDIDDLLFDDTLPLGQKLGKLQEAMLEHEFGNFTLAKQQEVISYLNSCKIFSAWQALHLKYAVSESVGGMIIFPDVFVNTVFDSFTLVIQSELIDTPGGKAAVEIGVGLGISGEIFYDDERYTSVIPLNQTLKTIGDALNETEPDE